jgi:hypothetical protein
MLFLKGRLFFHHVTDERAKHNSNAPSVLIAYGNTNIETLKSSGLPGAMTTHELIGGKS